MKICIDIQAAIAQRAGVGRYTKLLVEHLAPLAGDDELGLFYFDFKRQGIPFPVGGAEQRRVGWVPGRIVQQAWKSLGAPPFDWFSGSADVFHFPNFIRPPLSRGASVVTIHDVSFLRFPETMEEKNYRYMSGKIRDTVARADRIITDCAFVADELHELLEVPREKLRPIPLGMAREIAAPEPEAVERFRKARGLDRPYLLHVGTLEPRKNHLFLLKVFEALAEFDGDLVIAGMKGWKYEPILEAIARSPRAARIHYLDYTADEDLPALYAGAEAFLFPSLYEGFGFPPLEAMACGTPVLSSTAGSLEEVLGDGALLLTEFEVDAWAAALQRLLSDPAPYIEAGTQRCARYAWAECARQTWDVYREFAS